MTHRAILHLQGAKRPLEMTAGHFVPIAEAGRDSASTYMSRAGAVRPGHRVLLQEHGSFALRTVTKVTVTKCTCHGSAATQKIERPPRSAASSITIQDWCVQGERCQHAFSIVCSFICCAVAKAMSRK